MSSRVKSVEIINEASDLVYSVKKQNGIYGTGPQKPPKAKPEKKGKTFDHNDIKLPKIKKLIIKIAKKHLDLDKLGVTEEEFHNALAYSLRRLKKDQGRITVSSWLGETFEVLAPKHPAVVELRNNLMSEAIVLFNEGVNKKGIFFNYKGDESIIAKGISEKSIIEVRSLWIKRPGDLKGKKFCDRAIFAKVSGGKYVLLLSEEYKTEGVKLKELDLQQVARNLRFFDDGNTDDTKITFTECSNQKNSEIELKDILLNSYNPGGRIGIKSSSRTKLEIRFPKKKLELSLYYRQGIDFQTAGIRAVLQAVFYEM